ncbi:MAG TPA: alpha-glucan family phosphorylase [Gemmatimonadales bacterium]|nr:alpha-glucan family phosphorylase [Gemmatimonadales bacterium]
MITPYLDRPRIAYFSMEIALASEIPTYSGGLGVLAGDTLRSAADLRVPMVGVTLASRKGYFRQEIDASGRQVEHADEWDPAQHCVLLRAKVAVRIEGREVWVASWLYVLESNLARSVPLILLDTDLPENHPQDRTITHHLYGGDSRYRFKQEIVLGVGGLRMLQALGFRIRSYHMNEGHSALLAVELLRVIRATGRRRAHEPGYDAPAVRAMCHFTTHTPVQAGHDQFDWKLVEEVLGELIEFDELKRLAGAAALNMTQLALNLSEYVNGVARRHAEVSRQMFPGYDVHAVTNGVHPATWTSAGFAALFDRHIPGWRHEPQLLTRADQIPDADIWRAHEAAKARLIARVAHESGVALDPALPIIGFARRMTAYKRPELLFSDPERLRAIARRHPFQVVLAGKAHPRDQPGRQAIENIQRSIGSLAGTVRAVYVQDYDMAAALDLVSGSDVWLNTPLRPHEASGTSGMKASFNGVPQLSVLDGWWVEGCIEGVTGWAIGSDQESANGEDGTALYDKLEGTVLPLWHGARAQWIAVMKGAIGKNASYFNSHRMLRRYAIEAYLR